MRPAHPDELLARKFHDNRALGARRDKGVVLFGRDAGHGLEPVRVVGRALGNRPILHRIGHDVCHRWVKRGALRDCAFERLEHVLWQTFLHHRFVEHHTAEQFGYFAHALPPNFQIQSNFERRPLRRFRLHLPVQTDYKFHYMRNLGLCPARSPCGDASFLQSTRIAAPYRRFLCKLQKPTICAPQDALDAPWQTVYHGIR